MKDWNIIEIIRWGTDFFASKEIESPRLNIELMLCEVLRLERVSLYTRFDQPLLRPELDRIKEMVVQRSKHVPLQYILGSTNFYGLEIKVRPGVLIPRPETEQLAELVITRNSNKKDLNIVDVGAGSGCIAIALGKSLPGSKVTGYDISPEAIKTATENAVLNKADNVEFRLVDILSVKKFEKRYDIFVSNPPYIPQKDIAGLEPEVNEHEPINALTDESDGLTFYRRFAEIIPLCVKSGGEFYLEIGHGQYESIRDIFRKNNIDTNLAPDYSGKERMVYGAINT